MEKQSKIIIIVLTIICLGLGGTVGYLVLNGSQEKCNSKVPETNSKNDEVFIEERPVEDDYEEEVNLVSIEEVKKYTSKDILYVYLDIPCEDDSCLDPVSHSIVICDQKEIDYLLNIFDKIETTEQGPESGLITAKAIRFITIDSKVIDVVLSGEDLVWINGTEFKLKNASDYFYSFDGKTLTR